LNVVRISIPLDAQILFLLKLRIETLAPAIKPMADRSESQSGVIGNGRQH
jgi:hypothetical protein